MVKSVVGTKGTLKIGADSGSAAAWASGTNDEINASNKAFWTPLDNYYGDSNAVFAITAKDDDGAESSSAIDVIVEVANVNDAPVVSGIDGKAYSVNLTDDSDNYVDYDAEFSISDGDDNPDFNNNFNGGYITITQTGGTANGEFYITSGDLIYIGFGPDSGNLTGTPSAGAKVFVKSGTWKEIGVVDDTLTGQNGANLKISFTTTDASHGLVDVIGQYIQYKATKAGTRTFELIVNDGGSENNTSNTSTFTLTVPNSAPVIDNLAGDSFDYYEDNGTITIEQGLDVNISDADGADFIDGNLTVSIISGGIQVKITSLSKTREQAQERSLLPGIRYFMKEISLQI